MLMHCVKLISREHHRLGHYFLFFGQEKSWLDSHMCVEVKNLWFKLRSLQIMSLVVIIQATFMGRLDHYYIGEYVLCIGIVRY